MPLLPQLLTFSVIATETTRSWTDTCPQLREALKTTASCLSQSGLDLHECPAGNTPFLSLHLESRGDDGAFEFRPDGDRLTLCGDEEGLRCGLYTLLQHLGFHWFAPHEPMTRPTTPLHLDSSRLAGRHQPDFSYRGLHVCAGSHHYCDTVGRWMSYNRMNRKLTHLPEDDVIGPRLRELGLRPDTTVHAYDLLIPDETYFATHPEFFSLIDGRRITQAAGGQLCLASHAMRAAFAAKLLTLIRQKPHLGVFGFCPNDGYGHCECPDCLALDTAADHRNRTINGRIADFVQDICARIGREAPGVMLGHYSYSNFADFIELIEQPPANLLISFTQFHCQRHPIAAADCPENSRLAQRFEHIRRKVANVYIYDYYHHRWNSLPGPIWNAEIADFRYWKKMGVKGFLSEVNGADGDSWRAFGPAYYLATRLLWNADLEWHALFDELCRHKFGRAANLMRDGYFGRLQQAMDEKPGCFLKQPHEFAEFFTLAVQADLGLTLRQAALLEPANPYLQAEQHLFAGWLHNFRERRQYGSAREVTPAPLAAPDDAVAALPVHLVSYSSQLPDLENDTRVRLRANAEFIRIDMIMFESQPDAIRISGDEGTGGICRSDNVEIFLADPDHPQICYHFLVSAGGAVAAAQSDGPRWNWAWPHHAEITASIGADRWTMTMNIPKSDLGVQGRTFAFSLVRNRFAGGNWQILGTPDGGAFFKVENYILAP